MGPPHRFEVPPRERTTSLLSRRFFREGPVWCLLSFQAARGWREARAHGIVVAPGALAGGIQ